MCHQLVAFLRRCIKRNRIIHAVIRRERHLLVTAIHTRRRRINQMIYRVMTTRFQDMIEANQVRLYIRIRILNRIPHASLRRQIDHHIEMVLLKELVNQPLICQITFHKLILNPCRLSLLNHTQAIVLQRRVIIIIQIIQTYNNTFLHLFKQPQHQV